MNTQFKFEISISYVPYKDKPKYYGAMLFRKENITPSEMLGMVKDGFSFMAVLNDYDIKEIDDRFYQGRTANDVKQTNFIGVDVDDSTLTFNEYISTIKLKPTFAYTTPNDGIKGNRYRLIYIVSESIKEQSEFSSYYNGIISTLNEQTNTTNNDDCGAKIERLFNGNGKSTIKTFESGLIYSKNDLPKGENSLHVSTKQVIKPRKSKKANTNVEKDFFNLDFDEFYSKYTMKVFEPIMMSNVDFKGKLFAELNEDFINIKRFNKRGVLSRENKLSVGGGRKKYLWKVLQLKHKIKPTITSDELLFNAVFEIVNFIDNTDSKLTKSYIIELVDNVLNSECTIQTTNKQRIMINKKLADEMGISPRAAANKARGELNHAKIGEWYDVSISVGKNLKFAKENNIKVCRNTLKRFCKENGINPKGEAIKEEINNNIPMKEDTKIKAINSDILSVEKVDGTTHHTQHENALQHKIKHLQYVPNDEITNYINRTKNTMYFVSYSMAI